MRPNRRTVNRALHDILDFRLIPGFGRWIDAGRSQEFTERCGILSFVAAEASKDYQTTARSIAISVLSDLGYHLVRQMHDSPLCIVICTSKSQYSAKQFHFDAAQDVTLLATDKWPLVCEQQLTVCDKLLQYNTAGKLQLDNVNTHSEASLSTAKTVNKGAADPTGACRLPVDEHLFPINFIRQSQTYGAFLHC